MRNKLTDLNDHLFAQMERLGDEDLDKESLALELARAKGMSEISREIVGNARLVLDAHKAMTEHQIDTQIPQIAGPSDEK